MTNRANKHSSWQQDPEPHDTYRSSEKIDSPRDARVHRLLTDPRSRIRWKSLIYFIISASIIHKIIGLIYSLLPFPISVVAIIALAAKLSESWLDSQGFNAVARFLQSLINLSEDQIDAYFNKFWRHASLQDQNQISSQSNEKKYINPEFNSRPKSPGFQLPDLDLHKAQGIYLRQLAIKKFLELWLSSKVIRTRLFDTGFFCQSDEYSFHPTASVDFRAQGIIGISFNLKFCETSEDGIQENTISGIMRVTARINSGDILIDDPDYFTLTSITIHVESSWKEIVIL